MDDIFTQVFGQISDSAGSGAQTTGTVADNLIGLGLSFAAISQILNGVATSAAATPAMVSQAQNEMRYLQTKQASSTSWVLPAVLAGIFIYAVSRDN